MRRCFAFRDVFRNSAFAGVLTKIGLASLEIAAQKIRRYLDENIFAPRRNN
jgi:hypothetical protein